MNRIIRTLSVAIVVAVGGVAWGQVSAAHASGYPNSTCPTGALIGGFYNNATVLRGQTCVLLGATITGNVIGQPGNTGLVVQGTQIGGNLQDESGGGLVLEASSVNGNLQVGNTAGAVVLYSHVIGNSLFTNNSGGLNIQFNTFGTNPPSYGAGHGSLLIENTSGGANGGVLLVNNTIGNLLDCRNNSPAVVSQLNTAQHYGGQCALS